MLHKIICTFSVLFLMSLSTARGGADILSPPIQFTVHTHGVQLTENYLNAVRDAAQGFLMADGVNISLEFINSFDSGHVIDEGKIKGCPELENLIETKDVNLHIVNTIPCCGDAKSGLVGCSRQGKAMIILAPEPSMDPDSLRSAAILWMHELGHNMGLCHNICEQTGVMIKGPTFNDTHLDPCEVKVFNGGLPTDPICAMPSEQSCREACTGTQQ